MSPRHFNYGNDLLLLQQVVESSMKAFDILYGKYWEFLYDEAYKRLRDPDQSKDIVQEIFTHLWMKRETLSIDNLPAYLTISVRNKVFKVLARQKLTHPYFEYLQNLPATSFQPDCGLLWREFLTHYETHLNTLPARKQLIFRLRFQEDLSTSDIAARLGLSRKTVQNQLGKAIEQLRILLVYGAAAIIFLFNQLP